MFHFYVAYFRGAYFTLIPSMGETGGAMGNGTREFEYMNYCQ